MSIERRREQARERARRHRMRRAMGLEHCKPIAFSPRWRDYLLRDGRIAEDATDDDIAEALEVLIDDILPMIASRRHGGCE